MNAVNGQASEPKPADAAELIAELRQLRETLAPLVRVAAVLAPLVQVIERLTGTAAKAPAALPPAPAVTGDLSERIRAVLREASAPIKSTVIARRIGKDAEDSYYRGLLRRLVRAGEVMRLPGYRYWLAGRALPTEFGTNGPSGEHARNGRPISGAG